MIQQQSISQFIQRIFRSKESIKAWLAGLRFLIYFLE